MSEVSKDSYVEEDTQKGKYLVFSIGSEEYGIEIKYVIEIIGMQTITEVPELPDYVKGVINLRGKIIPVMDVRLRFKKKPREYDNRTCIIVIEINDIYVGLIIDRVIEVINIGDNEISDPPNVNKDFKNKYVKGIGKVNNNVKLLIDCEELLENTDI